MDYNSLKNRILGIKLGEKAVIYEIDEDTKIFVNKPLTVPTKLKNSKRYDPKKNFQIGLIKTGQKEFLPNHLRIMIDLELKKEDDPKNVKDAVSFILKDYGKERKITRTIKDMRDKVK